MKTPQLWHYTKRSNAIRICKAGGIITPAIRHAGPDYLAEVRRAGLAERWASQVVWLTTDPDVTFDTRGACGLTDFSNGDRSEVRFEVMPDQDVTPWSEIRGSWPPAATARLEAEWGARPDTWWVSGGPLKVVPSVRYAPVGAR